MLLSISFLICLMVTQELTGCMGGIIVARFAVIGWTQWLLLLYDVRAVAIYPRSTAKIECGLSVNLYGLGFGTLIGYLSLNN